MSNGVLVRQDGVTGEALNAEVEKLVALKGALAAAQASAKSEDTFDCQGAVLQSRIPQKLLTLLKAP